MSLPIPNRSNSNNKNGVKNKNYHQNDGAAAAAAPAPAATEVDYTIDVTIRFSASLPDLPLSISLTSYPHANTCTLKQLIRQSLPADCANRRIRLIYAGKALLDNDLLTSNLKRRGGGSAASAVPSRVSTPLSTVSAATATSTGLSSNSSDKGKTPVRDPPSAALPRIYIHCSIGDLTLPPDELEREARVARTGAGTDADNDPANPNRTAAAAAAAAGGGGGGGGAQPNNAAPSSPPPPRGFDRLLSSGFSPSEVASLRLQFLSIQSHTHTPDTMPSPTTLRSMEDAWLDNSDSLTSGTSGGGGAMAGSGAVATGAGGGIGTTGTTGTGSEATEQSALDDMLSGTAMGFFWPIGCLLWGLREEGVWSTRRKMAVIVGVCLNLIIGLVRYSA